MAYPPQNCLAVARFFSATATICSVTSNLAPTAAHRAGLLCHKIRRNSRSVVRLVGGAVANSLFILLITGITRKTARHPPGISRKFLPLQHLILLSQGHKPKQGTPLYVFGQERVYGEVYFACGALGLKEQVAGPTCLCCSSPKSGTAVPS